MDDKLEKYIKNHRDEMDDKNPRIDLWRDIEKELVPKSHPKSMARTHIYWRAAAVFLLLITSWLAYEKINHGFQGASSREMVAVSEELLEAETFYTKLIDQKRSEINQWNNKFGYGTEFENEIDVLDSMYVVLKKEMRHGNKEEMANAMILNLQIRVDILNQQIKILESIENSQKDEKINL